MPYIPQERRTNPNLANMGDLTFALYYECVSSLPENPLFEHLNEAMGALEAVKLAMPYMPRQTFQINALSARLSDIAQQSFNLGASPVKILGAVASAQHEFYRRYCAPYEDRKRIENGDVR